MAEKFEKSKQQVSILEIENAKLKWSILKIKRSVKHLVRLLLKEEESEINKKEDVNRDLRIKMKNVEVIKAFLSSSSPVPFLVHFKSFQSFPNQATWTGADAIFTFLWLQMTSNPYFSEWFTMIFKSPTLVRMTPCPS